MDMSKYKANPSSAKYKYLRISGNVKVNQRLFKQK
jgi:hypothetical protein